MSEFFEAALSMPTVVFTVLLGLMLLYWLVVIIGAFDFDSLDFLSGADADAADLSDLDGAEEGILSKLGLSGVPITITASIFLLTAWTVSFMGMHYFPGAFRMGYALTAATVAVAAGVIALGITILAIRPMRGVFATPEARDRRSLVGTMCRVTTQRVDGNFGQAEVDDGAAGLLIQVRCDEGNAFKRGQRAVIQRYDPRDEVFWIASHKPGDEFGLRVGDP